MSEAKELESLAPFEEWLQRGDEYGRHTLASAEDISSFKTKVQSAIDLTMKQRNGGAT